MEQTDAPAATGGRPHPWLLIALGIAVVLFVLTRMWGNPSAPAAGPSNAVRTTAGQSGEPIDPAQLDVRLEALTAEREPASEADRNPFRFAPKAAPVPVAPPQSVAPPVAQGPPPPPVDPGPPPITVKFIGVVEPRPGDKVAAFSDCRITTAVREGGVILGQYRLVRIGVESAVVEYLDGQGRTTLRMQGQECVSR